MNVTYGGLTINYSRMERSPTGEGKYTAGANLARALLWIAEREGMVEFRARVRSSDCVDRRTLLAMEVAQADTTLATMTDIASTLDVVDANGKLETARWWSAARHFLDTTTAEWPPSKEILAGRRPVHASPGSGVDSYPTHRGVLPPPEIRTSGQPRWLWGDIRRWAMQNGRMNHLGTEVRKLANAKAGASSAGDQEVARISTYLLVRVGSRRYLRLSTEEIAPFVLGLFRGAGRDVAPVLYRAGIDRDTAAHAAD